MSIRKFLLAIGVIFVLGGMGLSFVWINRMNSHPADTARTDPKQPAMLVALHQLPTGTLLRQEDFGWKEIPAGPAKPGLIMRGMVTDSEYLGALTRRNFVEGEALLAADLIKPGDRRFLSATLKPGHRAVSFQIDAPHSSAGLLLPGDHVDVILTQTFDDKEATLNRRSVGETVLRNRRVLAIDQVMERKASPAGAGAAAPKKDTKPPKTLTLEVTEQEAEALFVAMQMGKLQVAVRALEGSASASASEERPARATWAGDVSPAIKLVSRVGTQASSGSTVESSVRRPPPSVSTN